jgi:DUF1365 family protein
MSVPETQQEVPLRSCLYECRVMHQRRIPRRNRFEHGVFLVGVDLDELGRLDGSLRFFGHNRGRPYEFRDSDHLRLPAENPGATLRDSLASWLQTQDVSLPADARIFLITLTRVAGYIFNPVSFYFCEKADSSPICAVAEVGNTFGELKPYLVPLESAAGGGTRFRVIVPKHYYVSPFSTLDLCFDFRLRLPGERLEIVVNDVAAADGETHLISTLVGERRPFTDRELLRLTLRYPLVTLRVITLIHWHALRLWWKGFAWHRKSARTDLQRDVLRPHASLRTAGVRDSAK